MDHIIWKAQKEFSNYAEEILTYAPMHKFFAC